MALETVKVRLPRAVYQRLRQRAETKHRSIELELAEVVEEALGEADAWDGLSDESKAAIEQLRVLDDADLWRAARMALPHESSARMQDLVDRRQAGGLSAAEAEEAERLRRLAERVLLVRAEAAALLHMRGHDISTLRAPSA